MSSFVKKYITCFFVLIILFCGESSFSQFSRENIETDSSNIEIVRNSLYRVYEETFKNKDLIWYSVRYINDTNQINTEGWETKKRIRLGTWNEYSIEGELLYTLNYDSGTSYINKEFYPDHGILEKMKQIADSMIINEYSKNFFDNYVRFSFTCNAYDKEGYVGSWEEPLKRNPESFVLRYDVRIDSSEWQKYMIGIELDKNGKYRQSNDIWNNCGFENVQTPQKTFLLNRTKALEIAIENGLQASDTVEILTFLKWESFKKGSYYNGEFKYYIAELKDIIKNINPNGRSRVEYKYKVYTFNPWSGEFINVKKMKQVQEWEKFSGSNSGFIPDE